MQKELLKLWVIVAVAFLLLSGILLRVMEYQLPAAAKRIHAEVGERYDALAQQDRAAPIPDSENAMLLYEEAYRAMIDALVTFPERDGYFTKWKVEGDPQNHYLWELQSMHVLPLPSQPFPDALHETIRNCVAAYQPVIDRLHLAANMTLPDTLWEPPLPSDPAQDRLYANAFYRMDGLLYLEALVCVLDKDEEGAMQALHALAAWNKARGNNAIWILPGLRLLLGRNEIDRFQELLHFGMEHNVFSATSLETLQDMFTSVPEITRKDMVKMLLANQKQTAYWQERTGVNPSFLGELLQKRLAPVPGDGLLWYETRLYVYGMTAAVAGAQARQRYLLGDGSAYLAELVGSDQRTWYFDYMQFVDPFDRFDALSINYFYHYDSVMRSYNHTVRRLRFLRLILALGRFRLENGGFPKSIAALVDYIPEDDIHFFSATSYLYERTDTGWILHVKVSSNDHRVKPMFSYPLGTPKIEGHML